MVKFIINIFLLLSTWWQCRCWFFCTVLVGRYCSLLVVHLTIFSLCEYIVTMANLCQHKLHFALWLKNCILYAFDKRSRYHVCYYFYFCYTCCPDLTPCFLLLWLLGAIELWELLEEKYCLGSVAKPVEHDDVVTSVSVNSSVAKFVSTGYDKTWVLPCNIFIIVSVSCVMPWLCWVNGLFKKVHFCTFVIYMQVWPLWLTQYWIIFTCHVH